MRSTRPVSTRQRLSGCGGVIVVVLTTALMAQPDDPLAVGIFSTLAPGAAPDGWEPLRFPSVDQDTAYTLVVLDDDKNEDHDGRVVLRADSRMSASALITDVKVDTGRAPYLHWSWATDPGCFSGNWREPDSDDFPLRLFVIFEESGGLFRFFKRLRPGFRGDAILYVSDAPSEPETNRSSHLSDRIRVVSLDRDGRTDRWGRHVRNVHDDYVDLFGSQPRDVDAVGVMTDTDNSGTECVSHFGDLYFSDVGEPGVP